MLVSYLSLTLLVLLGLEVPFGLTYADEQAQRAARTLEQEATTAAELAEEAIEQNEAAQLPRLAAEYSRITAGRVLVLDARGGVLASSHPLSTEDNQVGAGTAVRQALAGSRVSGTEHSTTLDTDVRYIVEPAASGTIVRGAVRITVPSGSLDAAVSRMWTTLLVAGLAVLAAVTSLGYALARWTTRPLRALEQATDELASGTLPTRAATDLGPPELRRLATTFNHTATQLQQLIGDHRSFAADASHQLRTPLTALRLRLENLEPGLAPAEHANLEAAFTEIDRLADLVEQLLALARIDNDEIRPVPVDLDPIVADRAMIWAPLAAERRVRITVTGDTCGPVIAIPGALEQILDNLISNALRVAPPDTAINVSRRPAEPGNPTVMLHVIDQGPGMNPHQRARALDRFWRAPGAPKGGAGLGLAIVAKLVDASGGRIDLHEAPGGGLDVTITLRTLPAFALEPADTDLGRPKHRRAAASPVSPG
jgi:signal transduction histidine kinase